MPSKTARIHKLALVYFHSAIRGMTDTSYHEVLELHQKYPQKVVSRESVHHCDVDLNL